MTTLTDQELFAHANLVNGKVVLITGGSNGIGRETAIAFAKNGAKIIIGDIDMLAAKEVVEKCRKVGGDAMCMKSDVTSWEEQLALFEAGFEKYGRIDYVIANAGVAAVGGALCLPGPSSKPPQKPVMTTIDVNVVGVIYTVRLGQYYLMKTKGSEQKAIVVVGSMAGTTAFPAAELYAASKHAVMGLVRSLYEGLKNCGIRIGVVCPWFVSTNILSTSATVMLAGMPKLPANRVAAAIFAAATDPDWETSGSSYMLPDDGEVFRIDRQDLTVGVYKLLTARIVAAIKAGGKVNSWVNAVKDIAPLFSHLLWALLLAGPLLAYRYISKKRT